MGWSNYVVIDDWKIMIEVAREIDKDYGFNDDIDSLLKHMEDTDYDLLNEKCKDMTVDTLTKVFEITRKSMFLCAYYDNFNTKMFLRFLTGRRIHYRVESELDIEGKYKGYKRIER